MKGKMNYSAFLQSKEYRNQDSGFKAKWIPDFLFDFQKELVEWAVRQGRCAIFADCGLGKSVMELVWAKNVCLKTKGRVLLLSPIAVGAQMKEEAAKFGITKVRRSRDGSLAGRIVISNYERLHYFNPSDFSGIVCDESSCLKNFNGVTKHKINIFVRSIPYRLLATATPAPNDFIELGTSSEALGYLGYMDMLSMFFRNEQNNCALNGRSRFKEATKWRLKGHARKFFWRWITSWSRSIRYPSDLGFDDGDFRLPQLEEVLHEIHVTRKKRKTLIVLPAVGLKEVRNERKATVQERCEKVAELVNNSQEFAVVWCNLNKEGDLLEKLIPDAVQVSGRDNADIKERKLIGFTQKQHRVLITKPKIGAWGLNWQHCNHVTFFPNYSYEQYYQAIRRCWRFGQTRPVHIDLVYTHGDRNSIRNLRRKQEQADDMFTSIVHEMSHSLQIKDSTNPIAEMEKPSWV